MSKPTLIDTQNQPLRIKSTNTEFDSSQHQCIHQLFESQVERTPDAPAVVFENQQLTYRALNARANQLAHYLKRQRVEPEILVGLAVERSLDMLVGLLGILKAGGAYVPLDPAYPKTRLAAVLSDAQISVLLTQKALMAGLPQHHAYTVCLDTDWGAISQESDENPINRATPDNLAYVIYTSGSTGKPKGVMIPHRAVYNHTVWMQNQFSLTEVDKVLQKTPFTFDASVWEFFTPLSVGAQLYMAKPGGHQDSAYLVKIIAEQKITILQTVPTLLQMLLNEEKIETCHTFKQLFCGGEILSIELKERVFAKLDAKLINLYGPTEACIDTTFFICQNGKQQQTVPIGCPIDNTQVYILDDNLQQVPNGVAGEMYIGGTGLARGYLNRPELTAEKFIPNPFSNAPESRLYKTGDLARYLSDGNIEFFGRIDHQVKIRGFRIELSEIEAVLNQHPDVREAVVTAPEIAPGDKRLVAYFIDKKLSNTSALRHFLQDKLPNYMIPAAFVRLDKMPLMPNGKIDRNALPLPTWEGSHSAEGLPTTPTEIDLFKLWGNVFGMSQFNIHDNFFELGGHSLLATRIISRVRETFQTDIPISVLFDKPTVATLAAQIDSRVPVTQPQLLSTGPSTQPQSLSTGPSTQPVSTEEFALSVTQQSFWLFEQLYPNTPTFNIPLAFKLTGILNVSALEQALSQLVRRHEALRTTFEADETGTPRQRIALPSPITVTLTDLTRLPETVRAQESKQCLTEEVRRPFNLAQDHLFRITVLHLQEQEHLLLLIFHHLITDGWSIGLFIRELTELYATFMEQSLKSPPGGTTAGEKGEISGLKGISYIDFCHSQQQWLQSEQYQSQLAYWQSQLHSPLPVLDLPTDYPRSSVQTHQGARQPIVISPTLTGTLRNLSQQQNVTLFMTLLAAFKTLLYRYTGQTELTVGTAVAGRQQVKWENVMGLFINNLVLRTPFSGQTPFVSLLSQVREIALAAYNHQDLPFQSIVDSLHSERNLSHNLLFQTFFLLQNFDFPNLNLSGLTTTPLEVSTGTAKFDLTLELYEKTEGLTGWFEYNTTLFSAATMQRMVGHFQTLLESIVAAPKTPLSTLPLLTETERQRLCRSDANIRPTNPFIEFTKADIEQSIPERFEQQVKKYPHHLAVKTKHEALTYLELNQQANQVARTLLKHRIAGEKNIGLLFEHEASMIVGILGVLKAGLTYVPLAPELPTKRLVYILEDSQASVVLTNHKQLALAQELTRGVLPVININQISPNPLQKGSRERFSPDSIAYILYTSGSTGQPKGVVQNHRNVLHFIRNYTNNLHINADDKLTLLPAYSFDAAVMDIFAALLNGATLYPINIKEDSLANPVNAFINKQQITIYHSTPTVYRHFISALTEADHFPKLRLIVLGGEEVYKSDVQLYQQQFTDNCLFINGLGPTESTVTLQYFINKRTSNPQPTVPIGYPVEETEIVLLNEAGEETELYGEIAIKSAYVALGYWQKPETTQAAFRPHGNRRLYRTGDMGRLRADGSLGFVGRKDSQVKLRGYRIELGEIEATLGQHPAVQQTAVILWEEQPRLLPLGEGRGEDSLPPGEGRGEGEKRLVAYLVPVHKEGLEKIATDELRQFLNEKLPDYMVPSAFIRVEAIPLLPNGKVNRRLLPVPELNQATIIAPRNPLERQLTNIWQKVLGTQPIGIHDNFFDQGGHSLLAITLLTQIEKTFGKRLPLITVFQAPTVAQQAAILKEEGVPDGRMLEIIQSQGTCAPFFFIGSTNYARALTPVLGKNQPVYGLNIFGLQPSDGTIPSLNVKDIARQYCQEIQTVQPEGPYYLCGYCADAKIALEIAQQFQAEGEKIALLAFIDVNWQPQNRSIHRHWHNFLEMGFSYLSHKIRQRFDYTKTLLKLSLSKKVETFYRHTRKKSPRQLQDLQFINSFYTALNNYEPQPYFGRITLFLSRDWRLKPSTVLSQLATGGLEVYEVAGYHDNLFVSPQVEVLGEQLKHCLENN